MCFKYYKMWFQLCILGLLVLQYCQPEVILKAPKKLSNCKAQLDDNSIIDLSSQDKPNLPR